MSDKQTPKFLLDIENRLRENARDYIVSLSYEGKIYYIASSNFAGYGLASFIAEELKEDYLYSEREDEDSETI